MKHEIMKNKLVFARQPYNRNTSTNVIMREIPPIVDGFEVHGTWQ